LLSPTATQFSRSVPSFRAAARNKSGSGLARCTSSLVITGMSLPSPNNFKLFRSLAAATGGDCPGHAQSRKRLQQILGSRKDVDCINPLLERFAMKFLQASDFF